MKFEFNDKGNSISNTMIYNYGVKKTVLVDNNNNNNLVNYINNNNNLVNDKSITVKKVKKKII